MNSMKNIINTTFCLSILFLLTSCATVISGPNQKVRINSTPTAAHVIINNESAGETPLTAKLKRHGYHLIQIKLDGYEPYEIVTKKGFNPITLGNIMIGGAVGMIIDLATGGIYTVNPSIINAKLKIDSNPELTKSLTKIRQLRNKRIYAKSSDNIFNYNLGISLYGNYSNEEILKLETGTAIRGVVADPDKMGGCDLWDKIIATKIEPDKWKINHLKSGQSVFAQIAYDKGDILFKKIKDPFASHIEN